MAELGAAATLESREPWSPTLLLLIEDNPADVQLVELTLQELAPDRQLAVAGDAPEGLRLLREWLGGGDPRLPEAILLDMKLGASGDGPQVLRELTLDPLLRRIPVFVLSGSASQQDVDTACDLRVAGYFQKPITGPAEILRAVLRYLELAERPSSTPLLAPTSTPGPGAELFRLAVESAPCGMLTVDREGTIVLANAEIERMFDYPRGALIGQPLELLIPERFRPAHPALRRRFVERPEQRAMGAGRDLYGRRRDGSELPVEIGLNPVEIDGALHVLSSVVDITARQQAEERFRLAVEASPHGVALVDAHGTIALVNAEVERMFGYTRQELIGESIELLVPERGRAQHVDFRREYLAEPTRRLMGAGRDLYGRRRDGSELPVEIGLNPIETGGQIYVLSSIVDITERKRAERVLAEKTRALERSNAELEQFAYVASHDLQEPLRMVASFTQLLAKRCGDDLDEQAQEYLGYALEGAQRMQDLIRDLLAYSRITGGERERVPVDLRFALDAARANLRLAIEETGAEVLHDDDLGWVQGDDRQLAEVFQNLLGNALKFRGEGRPRIEVTSRLDGRRRLVQVRDNGIGIAPAQQQRIFEVFQRLHPRGSYPGTGIGLAICQRVIDGLGGRIWVESDGHTGSTFCFELPAAGSPTAG